MTETEQRSLIPRKRYDLTIPERSLIERGLAIAESLGKKFYICPTLGAKFVLIPAGTFMMGSPEDEPERYDEETLHEVTISKPFYMQITQVTQGQWKKVMGNNHSSFSRHGDNYPVEKESWDNVQEFIKKLNRAEKMDRYRLPTEAEWEYACRAGSTTAYCFGDDPNRLGEYAWYKDNSGDETHPVGMKKPNAWGLYDMHGNVWELVQDKNGSYPSIHDFRGGSYNRRASRCRSAINAYGSQELGYIPLGFRLLRAVEQDIYKPDRQENAKALQSKSIKEEKQITKSKEPVLAKVRETGRNGDFIAYDNGTVLDKRTNLMWAAKDNGENINWDDAKYYCENYRGGGYTDWRMPTQKELEGLYDAGKAQLGSDSRLSFNHMLDEIEKWCDADKSQHGSDSRLSNNHMATELIIFTGYGYWASETNGSDAAGFDFLFGSRDWLQQSFDGLYRVLPIRSVKNDDSSDLKNQPGEHFSLFTPDELQKDGDFIAYDNGTVLDTKTNLMWAAKDNGSGISWANAPSYCENYRGGGYTDWRMPTLNELEGLYNESKCYELDDDYVYLTDMIQLSSGQLWSSDTCDSGAVFFDFNFGIMYWDDQYSSYLGFRALPVRNAK